MCLFCNHELDYKKESTLKNHLKCGKHIQGDQRLKKPITLQETMNNKDKKELMIMDFTDMMISCNIPLEKKTRWNSGLKNMFPGHMPSSHTLCKDYLPKALTQHKKEIMQKIDGQPISIMIDETPDKLSRNVVNTLFHCGFTGETFG